MSSFKTSFCCNLRPTQIKKTCPASEQIFSKAQANREDPLAISKSEVNTYWYFKIFDANEKREDK